MPLVFLTNPFFRVKQTLYNDNPIHKPRPLGNDVDVRFLQHRSSAESGISEGLSAAAKEIFVPTVASRRLELYMSLDLTYLTIHKLLN